jgi:hypothetical protein
LVLDNQQLIEELGAIFEWNLGISFLEVFPEALSKISLILLLPEGSDWPLQLGLFAKSGIAEHLILRRVLLGITQDDLDRWTLVRLRSLHLFDVVLLLL